MSINSNECQYFPTCGGCKYLHLDRQEYRDRKIFGLQQLLLENEIDIKVAQCWIAPPNRRRVQLHVNNEDCLGFYQSNSKQIIKIEKCYVAHDNINRVIPQLQMLVKSIRSGTISKIQITDFDNATDLLFYLKKDLNLIEQQKITDFCKDHNVNASQILKSRLTNICQLSSNKITVNNIDLKLQSDVFLQASRGGLQKITQIINDFIDHSFDKKPSIVDLYSGFGLYSFAIVQKTKKLQLFEGSASMKELAISNIKNLSITSEVKASQRDLFKFPLSSIELNEFDLAIINPPRNGASSQVQQIADSKLEKLIYVSCNPKTFIRDYKIMQKSGFAIKEITAIDQFYSTDHFELVTILTR